MLPEHANDTKNLAGPKSGREEKRGSSLVKELLDWVRSAAVALLIVFLLHQFLFQLSTVKGHSMVPTLLEGEWLFVNKLVYLTGTPERGEIVILKDPDPALPQREYLVKRIIGIAGDRVEIRNGQVFVNGHPLAEPYVDARTGGDFGPFVVPQGQFFLMGDNRHRGASKDSRSFGAVSAKLIEGRADLILWPFGQLSRLTN